MQVNGENVDALGSSLGRETVVNSVIVVEVAPDAPLRALVSESLDVGKNDCEVFGAMDEVGDGDGIAEYDALSCLQHDKLLCSLQAAVNGPYPSRCAVFLGRRVAKQAATTARIMTTTTKIMMYIRGRRNSPAPP